MPIKHNEKDVIIDFEYTAELGSNDPLYRVRYHFTEGIGPTVSLSPCGSEIAGFDDNGHSYISLPSNMIIEIANFLESKKLVQRTESTTVNSPSKKISGPILPPVIAEKSTIKQSLSIAPPQITGARTAEIKQAIIDINDGLSDGDLSEPLSGEPLHAFQSFSEVKAPKITDEEKQKLLEERKVATEKSQNKKKVVHRKDREDSDGVSVQDNTSE